MSFWAQFVCDMANASLSPLPLFPLRFVPPCSPHLPSSFACPCCCGCHPHQQFPPLPTSCHCCRPILALVLVVKLSSGSLLSFRCHSLTPVSHWPHCSHPSLSLLSCCPLVHHLSHLIFHWPHHSRPIGPHFHPASSCLRRWSVIIWSSS